MKIFLCTTTNLFILLLPFSLIAQEQISTSIVAAGGSSVSSKDYNIVNTIGQPAIGRSSNSNYNILSGFWNETSLTTSIEEQDFLPVEFILEQNYPNPFNPATVISYQLPVTSKVSLKIYDILGSEVATLINEEKAAGYYKITFNASHLASGIYFYRIQTGSFSKVKKMILMK